MKIVVKILEYYPKGDEIDYSKEREESNAKRDPKAWLVLEPLQQQRSSHRKLIKKTVFGDTIAKMVKAMAVVHLEEGEYIRAPQVPAETI